MPFAKITGPGLAAIAVAVALLWACVLRERALTRHAFDERVRVMREIELMQRRSNPVPVWMPHGGVNHRHARVDTV